MLLSTCTSVPVTTCVTENHAVPDFDLHRMTTFVSAILVVLTFLFVLLSLFFIYACRPLKKYHPLPNLLSGNHPKSIAKKLANYHKIFPYSKITASPQPVHISGQPYPLHLSYLFNSIEFPIDSYLTRDCVAGLFVMCKGRAVFEKYSYGLNAETEYHIASCTKSFVGTMIGIALKEGAIASLDDLIEHYAPRYKGSAYGQTTIRNVMMMSSGIDFDHRGPWYKNWFIIYLKQIMLGEHPDVFNRKLGRACPQGQAVNYIALDTQVLGAVLHGAYNRLVADTAQEKIWHPLGMSNSAKWLKSEGEDASTLANAFLMPTLRNFAMLGQLYLQGGTFRGEQLLPPDWIELCTQPQRDFQRPGNTKYPNEGYAMQFWVPEGYDGEFYAAGLNSNFLWVDRKRDVVIAQFGAAPNRKGVKAAERHAAFRAISARAAELMKSEAPLRF
jgi:CubicO group peptidase (beta-lactamase class C family)